jgi:hypothetical protein
MSDTGTITEIEPEDGLGWIEMENGDRVRFGGTSCKAFVPAIGMKVRVVSTRPGYGGTVKATELQRLADAPRTFAKEGKGSAPRTSLHSVQQAGIRASDLLLALLARADADDKLHADLKAASFETGITGRAGCPNPWFFAVAQDAEGNAIGLYAHPMFNEELPWLRWQPGTRVLRLLAFDSAAFFPGLLAQATASGVDQAVVQRLRKDLVGAGMTDAAGQPFGTGQKVDWLPPDEAELKPLDAYLAETDGGAMERGLIAHAYGSTPNPQATRALQSLYQSWGWTLPSWE